MGRPSPRSLRALPARRLGMTEARVAELIRAHGLWSAYEACRTRADFTDFSNLTLLPVIRQHLPWDESSAFVDTYLSMASKRLG